MLIEIKKYQIVIKVDETIVWRGSIYATSKENAMEKAREFIKVGVVETEIK